MFLKPGSKISTIGLFTPKDLVFAFYCLPLLSDSQSCVKMVGRVSACEWPIAISSLLWLSHVCIQHLVTLLSKEAVRHTPHIKETLSTSIPVKLYKCENLYAQMSQRDQMWQFLLVLRDLPSLPGNWTSNHPATKELLRAVYKVFRWEIMAPAHSSADRNIYESPYMKYNSLLVFIKCL